MSRTTRPEKTPAAAQTDHRVRRVLWIDVIRAFAIIGIVLTHSMTGRTGETSSTITTMFIGSASLFFMTSGALIFPVRPTPGKFLRRRLKHIVPQLILWTLIYALLQWWLTPDYNLGRSLAWAFFKPTWSEGWFLYVLVALYLMAPVISPWLTKAPRHAVETFLALWLLSGLTPFAHANVTFAQWQTPVYTYFGYMGYMVAGYYLTRWPVSARPVRQRAVIWCILLFLGVVAALRLYATAARWGYSEIMVDDASFNVMAMCMLWFALLQNVRRLPVWASVTVTWISLCSFGIYLTHSILLHYVPFITTMSLWPAFAVTLGISAFAAHMLRWLRLDP